MSPRRSALVRSSRTRTSSPLVALRSVDPSVPTGANEPDPRPLLVSAWAAKAGMSDTDNGTISSDGGVERGARGLSSPNGAGP